MKNELIKINFDKQTCDARELHSFLEVQLQFTKWIDTRIADYSFLEGKDYILFSPARLKIGRPKRDYIITIDMAKELAMIERTPKGKIARQYFIKIEKDYKLLLKRLALPEYQVMRLENKANNKDFNEALKEFEQYAISQESTKSKMYYMLFNNMVNHALFDFPKEMKNIPDKLSIAQLKFSDSTRQVISDVIRKCIKENVPHKEIYYIAKERALKVAEALGVTPIPLLLEGANTNLLISE